MKKAMLFWSLGLIGSGINVYFSVPCLFDAYAAWYWRFASLIALGHILCLGMLFGATPRFLFWLSKIPFCSPNWLSIHRIPIIWVGQWMFFAADQTHVWLLLTGFLVSAFGLMLDRLDGKQAKSILASLKFVPQANFNSGQMADESHVWAWFAVEEENQHGEKILVDKRVVLEEWVYNLSAGRTIVPMFRIEQDENAPSPGLRLSLTHHGDWIDPLSDKFNFLPLLCYLAYRDLLFWPVTALMVSSDLFSTVIREPFQSWPVFRRLQKYTRESKASPFGKTKVIWQILASIAIVPAASAWLPRPELPTSTIVASCLLALGILAGVLSILSRLIFWNSLLEVVGLRRAYQSFKKGYEHDVEEEMK